MRRADREINDKTEIEKIIAKADVCRIAMANNNVPYLVTLNFGYVAEPAPAFYFHCAPAGRKLEMIKLNNTVCFELDTDHELIKGEKSCDWGMKFSSVVGYGRITVVEDEQERVKGLNALMDHFGASGLHSYEPRIMRHTTVLRLDVDEISCKKKI